MNQTSALYLIYIEASKWRNPPSYGCQGVPVCIFSTNGLDSVNFETAMKLGVQLKLRHGYNHGAPWRNNTRRLGHRYTHIYIYIHPKYAYLHLELDLHFQVFIKPSIARIPMRNAMTFMKIPRSYLARTQMSTPWAAFRLGIERLARDTRAVSQL